MVNTAIEEVVVISDDFFKDVDDPIFENPRVVQSWNEAVQMAKALQTAHQLKNRKKDESK
jgi:hypothetical protein